ncbi:MAG: antitoxin [Chloroflexi bacterium]|nr:antitoxin [Chloroflexota bacterium]
MTSPYQQLAERIQGEVLELDRVVQRSLTGWFKARQMPQEDMYLDGVALNLHGFYSGVERLFELIARRIDHNLPTSQTWHRDLIELMAQDVSGVRPAVIGKERVHALDEFRRFRHLVRNVYTMNLVPEKMIGLMASLNEQWQVLRAELLAFADFLEDLAQISEEQNES